MITPPPVLIVGAPRGWDWATAMFSAHHILNELVLLKQGSEALDFLHRKGPFTTRAAGNPALLLFDLEAGEAGGLETLRTIREETSFQTVPIVVVTASEEQKRRVGGLSAGFAACLAKPVHFHVLIGAIKHINNTWIMLFGASEPLQP